MDVPRLWENANDQPGAHRTEPQARLTDLCSRLLRAVSDALTPLTRSGTRADLSSWHGKDFLVSSEVGGEANSRRGAVKI